MQCLVLHPVALRVGRRAQPNIGRQTDDAVVALGIDAAGETVHVSGFPVSAGVFAHLANEDVAALDGVDVHVVNEAGGVMSVRVLSLLGSLSLGQKTANP